MKTLISILASMALALSATFAYADDHAAPSAPVGMVYGLDVSDPQAFAAAMGKYWSSPTGEKNPGIAILRQVVAGGGARDERRQVPDRDVPSVGAAVVRRPEDAAAREDERGLGGQAVEGLGRSNAGGIQRQIQRMERHADVAKGHLDRRRGGRGR